MKPPYIYKKWKSQFLRKQWEEALRRLCGEKVQTNMWLDNWAVGVNWAVVLGKGPDWINKMAPLKGSANGQ